jgi:hypothetical protein
MVQTETENTMSTQELHVSPKFFDGVVNLDAIDSMRDHLKQQHEDIVREAKAAQLKAVREEFCNMFGVVAEETKDDEGGGSISLRFPLGWNEDQATEFALHCMDLDLSNIYRGPGKFFQNAGIATHSDGYPMISVEWGLDI